MTVKKRTSLLTITRWCRHAYLPALYDQIVAQKGLRTGGSTEWVVLDGSVDDDDQVKLQEWVQALPPSPKVTIRYVSTAAMDVPSHERVIGNLREIGNQQCHGEHIVCLDDDDFYPTTRVRSALAALKKGNASLVGCTNHILLDYDMGLAFQLKGFHTNHAVNCTMAYTRAYAQTHHYDLSKPNAEEASFTDNFTAPMVQLDPFETIVQTAFSGNTFGKRTFTLRMLQGDKDVGTPLTLPFQKLVSKTYQDLFVPPVHKSPYTMVFYCGITENQWDPRLPNLLTPIRSLVQLATAFAAQNTTTVAVYGRFPFPKHQHHGVTYLDVLSFSFRCQYDTLVLWHLHGLAILKSPHLTARRIVVDLHTNFPDFLKSLQDHHTQTQIHKVMVKSAYHKRCLDHFQYKGAVAIVPHGLYGDVDPLPFSANPPNPRERTAFLYANPYGCGLGPILESTWPIFHRLCPDATLHVCHGLEFVYDPDLRRRIETLLDQPGVVHHGRFSRATILQLKQTTCTFDVYYTPVEGEIDLSAMEESVHVGCLPILANFNVFQECPGLKYDLGFDKAGYVQLAREFKTLVDTPADTLETWRQELKTQASPQRTWKDTAAAWTTAVA